MIEKNGLDQKMQIWRNKGSICWDDDKKECFFYLFYRGNWRKWKNISCTELDFGLKPLYEIVPCNTLAERLLELADSGGVLAVFVCQSCPLYLWIELPVQGQFYCWSTYLSIYVERSGWLVEQEELAQPQAQAIHFEWGF
jgi:hypothetical protein